MVTLATISAATPLWFTSVFQAWFSSESKPDFSVSSVCYSMAFQEIPFLLRLAGPDASKQEPWLMNHLEQTCASPLPTSPWDKTDLLREGNTAPGEL